MGNRLGILVLAGMSGLACGSGSGGTEYVPATDRAGLLVDYCMGGQVCDDGSAENRAAALTECLAYVLDDDARGFFGSAWWQSLAALRQCTAGAKDCATFVGCRTKAEEGPPPGEVCGEPGDRSLGCDGDTMLWCSGGEGEAPRYLSFECALDGWTCHPESGCVDRDARSCTGESCDGSRVVSCPAGRSSGFDCATLGAGFVCLPRPHYDGQFMCGPAQPDPGCQPDAYGRYPAGRCDGDVLHLCVGGRDVPVDCDAFGGLGCSDTSSGSLCR